MPGLIDSIVDYLINSRDSKPARGHADPGRSFIQLPSATPSKRPNPLNLEAPPPPNLHIPESFPQVPPRYVDLAMEFSNGKNRTLEDVLKDWGRYRWTRGK